MAVRKLKPIEERDPHAAAVLAEFDRQEEEAKGLDDGTWHCMTDAPRDGTEVELLVRHTNYRYANTDAERAMWEQVVRAKWIEFNGGGWTYRGMCGSACGWRPLPANDKAQEPK